ncbi:DUF1617 family protein [Marinilactibacillus kalidii]|uniref:DUF1617 family protein n=1 Tax=Marinilactibacillus kalidii TaxID=2820274 RepID=UPI001ABE4561|nr:DUF1617 family protein [Marinilactibacillus kalidii]
MKTLTFQNNQIQSIFNTLDATIIEQGKARRGKGKLQKSLIEADKEYQDNLKEIREEYFEVDEQGSIVKDEKGGWLAKEGKNEKEGTDKIQELLDEELKLDVLTYDTKLKAFYDKLNEDEFTTEKGKQFSDIAFDTLMDQLEEVFENNNEEETA